MCAIWGDLLRRESQINAQQAQIQLQTFPRVTVRCLWRSMSGITPLWTPRLAVNQSVEDHHLQLSAEKRSDCITFPSECWERALSEKRLCTDALRWAAAHITAVTVVIYSYQQQQLTTYVTAHCQGIGALLWLAGWAFQPRPLTMRGLYQGPVVQKV